MARLPFLALLMVLILSPVFAAPLVNQPGSPPTKDDRFNNTADNPFLIVESATADSKTGQPIRLPHPVVGGDVIICESANANCTKDDRNQWSDLLHFGIDGNGDGFVTLYSDPIDDKAVGDFFLDILKTLYPPNGAVSSNARFDLSEPPIGVDVSFAGENGVQGTNYYKFVGNDADVPEPATWLLFVTSLVGLLAYGWRQGRVA